MLCDICKVKKAVHKMKRGVFPGHFCEECFELVTQKISAGKPVKKPIVHPHKTNGERRSAI